MLKLWCEWGEFKLAWIRLGQGIHVNTHTTHNSSICSEEGLFLKTLALKLLMVASLHHQLS